MNRPKATTLTKPSARARGRSDKTRGGKRSNAPPMPSAALLIIGNEILSGRTHDANIQYLASRLTALGVRLRETRVVEDDAAAIGRALNALRRAHTYVFTTGGIGPTHDDITAASIAKALKLPLITDRAALARLTAHYRERGGTLNAARRRMAQMPKGAVLIDNPVSAAPGFRIRNVFVLAGVPAIMQAMFESVAPSLKGGPPLLSRTVRVNLPEGDFAAGLERLQGHFADVEIGSYPTFSRRDWGVRIVLRSQDAGRLDAAVAGLCALIAKLGGEAEEIATTAPAVSPVD
jgi:molybdenum cofactor synthesis domain-containing protein